MIFYMYMNKVFHLLYLLCCCVCNESDRRRVAKNDVDTVVLSYTSLS